MQYLTNADLAAYITSQDLGEILADGGQPDQAEAAALQEISSYLAGRYNMRAEYARIGTARNAKVVEVACFLTIFSLHSAIATRNIPQHRIDNAVMARDWLKNVQRAQLTVELPLVAPARQVSGVVSYGFNTAQPTTY